MFAYSIIISHFEKITIYFSNIVMWFKGIRVVEFDKRKGHLKVAFLLFCESFLLLENPVFQIFYILSKILSVEDHT